MADIRALVEEHYRCVNEGDFDADTEVFHPDVVTQHPGVPPMHGIAAFHEFVRAFRTGVPDLTLSLDRAYEAADAIIVEGTFRGTNTGPLKGPGGQTPATGRAFTLDFCDIFEIRDRKVTTHRVYYDQLSFLGQLELNPQSGRPLEGSALHIGDDVGDMAGGDRNAAVEQNGGQRVTTAAVVRRWARAPATSSSALSVEHEFPARKPPRDRSPDRASRSQRAGSALPCWRCASVGGGADSPAFARAPQSGRLL